MSNDPPTPAGGLGDLHRRRARGRPHPPNPRHEPERRTPISASETTRQHPTPQVSAPPTVAPRAGDQTQAEVKQDRAVGEPLVGAKVSDQPDVAQGSAGKSGKATTVRRGDCFESMEPARPVARDAEVEHEVILPSAAAGFR